MVLWKRTKQNIHLIDTESLHAWVTGVPQGKSHSRLNCFSAAVDVDLAFKFLENKLGALDPDSAEPVEKLLYLSWHHTSLMSRELISLLN